ncbi:transaldolase [Pseudonocardia sp.]|uniref:transaldolase n=1 Tax=Pseudonocardia sp. TaxID=60912 RepID=UPI002626FE7B|nr:transaldolase [Pseudonocardia sp.]
MADPLADLTAAGVAIWLDDLSRARLADGSLARLVRDCHVVGVTTNPTIFHKAISGSDLYDGQIHDLGARGVEVEKALRAITVRDVAGACDLLRATFDASQGVDGRVSIEVDPRLAHDTEKTIVEARRLWWMVDRPNLFIKVPATTAGLPAITACLAEGISVNVTLIFSRRRYAQVMDAFLDGVERARAAGHDLTRLASVASFFVSRVDTEIDQRLDAIGSVEAKAIRGAAAIANARLAFQASDEVFTSDRWDRLARAGARPQRPLWASTGVKDPAYADTRYVLGLVTSGVVNTMPEATLRAVADHGTVRGDTIRDSYDDAAEVMAELAEVGIDYDDVVGKLERDGLTTFQASWTALTQTLDRKLAAAKRGRTERDDHT